MWHLQGPESGVLEVTINYKSQVLQSPMAIQPDVGTHAMPGAHVCLSVSVLRAMGLRAAAVALAKLDAGMQYASEVGVNCYVRVQLSFLQKQVGTPLHVNV